MKNNEKMSRSINKPIMDSKIDTASAPEEEYEADENDDVVKLMQAIPNDIFLSSPGQTHEKSKASHSHKLSRLRSS